MFLPPLSSRVHCGRSDAAGRFSFELRDGVLGRERKWSVPEVPPNIADIDDQIAIVRENLRELIEQPAAYSGAADDELVAQRIADQTYAGDYQGGSLPIETFIAFQYAHQFFLAAVGAQL